MPRTYRVNPDVIYINEAVYHILHYVFITMIVTVLHTDNHDATYLQMDVSHIQHGVRYSNNICLV